MTEKTITLFLGSGASVFLALPTTKKFKEKLIEYCNESQPHEGSLKRRFLSELRGIISTEGFEDIEYVYQFIQEVENTRLGELIHSNKQLNNFFMKSRIIQGPENLNGYSLFEDILNIRKEINGKIFRYYFLNEGSSIDSHLVGVYNKLYHCIQKYNHASVTHIVTTNYDTIIERYCKIQGKMGKPINLIDGFRRTTYDQDVFDDKNFEMIREGNPNIVLLKLHGSLGWKQISEEDKDVIKLPIGTRIDPNYLDQYMLIYPTLDIKEGNYENEHLPYHSIFRRFKNLLIKTDVCIVVGYSFRDVRISDLLRQHLEGKLLIIVDPAANASLKYLYRNDEKIEEKITEREINVKQELFTYLIDGIKIGIIRKEFDEKYIDEIIQMIEYCIENMNKRELWNIRFHRQEVN